MEDRPVEAGSSLPKVPFSEMLAQKKVYFEDHLLTPSERGMVQIPVGLAAAFVALHEKHRNELKETNSSFLQAKDYLTRLKDEIGSEDVLNAVKALSKRRLEYDHALEELKCLDAMQTFCVVANLIGRSTPKIFHVSEQSCSYFMSLELVENNDEPDKRGQFRPLSDDTSAAFVESDESFTENNSSDQCGEAKEEENKEEKEEKNEENEDDEVDEELEAKLALLRDTVANEQWRNVQFRAMNKALRSMFLDEHSALKEESQVVYYVIANLIELMKTCMLALHSDVYLPDTPIYIKAALIVEPVETKRMIYRLSSLFGPALLRIDLQQMVNMVRRSPALETLCADKILEMIRELQCHIFKNMLCVTHMDFYNTNHNLTRRIIHSGTGCTGNSTCACRYFEQPCGL